jgi:hypothetical protein
MFGKLESATIAAILAAASTICCGGAFASSELIQAVQSHLYAGKTADAASLARGRLAQAPGDDQARFALGAVQFLRAVENLGRGLHRFGLRTDYGGEVGLVAFGLAGLPILRVPVPENTDPERVTYESLRAVLRGFVADLSAAEDTLAGITDSTIELPLNIGLIRLDLDADGSASDDEALWRILKRVADFPWLDEEEAKKFLTDFDRSDVPWLRAYCHLLMAIAEFPLAHDWRAAFEMTFHGVFPQADLPTRPLAEIEAESRAELEQLGTAADPPRCLLLEQCEEEGQAWLESPEGEKWQRITDLEMRLMIAGYADMIAFIHLNHWSVVDPERMANVLEHLEAMVRLSRESWSRIRAETDDRNEWIPNPSQSGVLPRMRVTAERVAGWMSFLDEFEAILQGRKLLPHWRFDQGINLRRFFQEPSTFDIVLLVQGSAALPYLEDGEFTTGDTWVQILDIFGGDFFRYFIWFN